jgi:hypothetical protein
LLICPKDDEQQARNLVNDVKLKKGIDTFSFLDFGFGVVESRNLSKHRFNKYCR